MKLHKIHCVPLEVCSAEQKIAYNMAFRADINQGDHYRAIDSAEKKAMTIEQIVEDMLDAYHAAYTYIPGRYNEDCITSALKSGLAQYLEKPFIATDYNQIGKAFAV